MVVLNIKFKTNWLYSRTLWPFYWTNHCIM